jgi:hypothetical protein
MPRRYLECLFTAAGSEHFVPMRSEAAPQSANNLNLVINHQNVCATFTH